MFAKGDTSLFFTAFCIEFIFCVITYSKFAPILKVIGQLFFEFWCTEIWKILFREKRAQSFENWKFRVKAPYSPDMGPCDFFLFTKLKLPLCVRCFISLRVWKCGFTHASRAEIRIFTPRDIKFRTILVRKTFSWQVWLHHSPFGSCCKLTLVRKRFIALLA